MKPLVLTFGEVMARLCPPGYQRLAQSLPGQLDISFAGAEANVAASLAMLGIPARFVSTLPDNALSDACLAALRGLNVDVRQVLKQNAGRLGLYFVEKGANQRPSRVIYDREGSAFSLTGHGNYNWESALDGANWFHTTGITPALSPTTAEATIAAVKRAKEAGLTVSCDLNFRNKLWRWKPGTPARELAQEVMRQILSCVDVVIANEEDAADVLAIQAPGTDVHAGKLDAQRYVWVAQQITSQFPTVSHVAITLRESVSATHNNWGAMLYTGDQAYFAPTNEGEYRPYRIQYIIDRVGGGDSFAAGLIYALNTPDFCEPASAIGFAAAASCLAHSIEGDFNYTTRGEVEALLNGGGSGRVVR